MIRTSHYTITFKSRETSVWTYTATGKTLAIEAPAFEIEGKSVVAMPRSMDAESVTSLKYEVAEHVYAGNVDDDLTLRIVFRVADESPVVRFRYELSSRSGRRLTRSVGKDAITYLRYSLADFPAAKEVRISEFQEFWHSYCLSELPVDFENEIAVMGPILAATGAGHSMLVAYEHGSQAPDAFVRFDTQADRAVSLRAVKGNYCDGQKITSGDPFRSVWFHFAMVAGDEAQLAASYRAFVLKHMSQNGESRKPYVFYNTWNYQERNLWWKRNTPTTEMTEERMLAEIEVAHRMGIEVFVIDAGWAEFHGDWRVSTERFPRGLKPIKALLNQYDMKLGLWFCNWAATSSKMLAEHQDCVMSWRGIRAEPKDSKPDAAHKMCLVSRFADAFARELIRLAQEEGVTYFKWDAIDQYGCDDPHHDHGGIENTADERADHYAFKQILAMTGIVDKLCAACPEAIVDFDVTEPRRSVGLAFLSSGKYFLINNGPYFNNYNIPYDWPTGKLFDSEPTRWSNVFVYPGPARGWVCRAPLELDKWIPSVLYLTHYLPDDPAENQLINIASLVLGQNGIWGDLPALSEEGVALFAHWLEMYKRVREDITESSAERFGAVGGSPEIHEKISARTGKGVVSIFASAPGTYEYVTRRKVAKSHAAVEGLEIRFSGDRARLTATFEKAGAKFVFFGV